MLWVTDFPLVEWDEEGGRWESLHHPFTCPNPKDVITSEATWGLDRARAMAYDVVYNGVELGGGSLRIHKRARLVLRCPLIQQLQQLTAQRLGFSLGLGGGRESCQTRSLRVLVVVEVRWMF